MKITTTIDTRKTIDRYDIEGFYCGEWSKQCLYSEFMWKRNLNFILNEKGKFMGLIKDKIYYIDFYQREYVWSDETVKILLDDIFVLGLYREGAAYVYLYYLQEAQS